VTSIVSAILWLAYCVEFGSLSHLCMCYQREAVRSQCIICSCCGDPINITCFCMIHALNTVPTRTELVSWFLHAVCFGAVIPRLVQFGHEALYYFIGYMNAQNNRCWSVANPMLTLKWWAWFLIFSACFMKNLLCELEKSKLWNKWNFVENKTEIMQHVLKMQRIWHR
jgi:hypothetical protein